MIFMICINEFINLATNHSSVVKQMKLWSLSGTECMSVMKGINLFLYQFN